MVKQKKTVRGGAREGAGRPKAEDARRNFTFRANGEVAKKLDSIEHRTDFIIRALEREMAAEKVGSVEKVESADKVERVVHSESGLAPDFSRLGDVYLASEQKDVSIPMFDLKVVAGFPIPLNNDEKAQSVDIIKLLCPNPEATYLIRVQGDSMIDANIHSGDIAIIDKSNRNPTPKQVAMCELNGEYTLKYFEMRDGCGWLIPANPEFPEIRVTPDDHFCVWGVVRYVIHNPVR